MGYNGPTAYAVSFPCKERKNLGEREGGRDMKRRMVALLLTLGMIVSLAACGGESGEGNGGKSGGKKTPEETAEAFVEALSRQDLDSMLACCYIEEYVDRVDYRESVEREGIIGLNYWWGLPWDQSMGRELAINAIRHSMNGQIKCLCASLLLEEAGGQREDIEKYWTGNVITENSPEFVDRLTALDFSQLKGLKIEPVEWDGEEISMTQWWRTEDAAASREMEYYKNSWGVDNAVELTVPMTLGEKKFLMGFTLVETEDRWQIARLTASGNKGMFSRSGWAVLLE